MKIETCIYPPHILHRRYVRFLFFLIAPGVIDKHMTDITF